MFDQLNRGDEHLDKNLHSLMELLHVLAMAT